MVVEIEDDEEDDDEEEEMKMYGGEVDLEAARKDVLPAWVKKPQNLEETHTCVPLKEKFTQAVQGCVTIVLVDACQSVECQVFFPLRNR